MHSTQPTSLEEINASAIVDTGALHLRIPEHIAMQLQLKARSQREVQAIEPARLRVCVNPLSPNIPLSLAKGMK